ncbi:hypothetical protein HK096_002344, partial [Nowakowskiella sp. JEL0078]
MAIVDAYNNYKVNIIVSTDVPQKKSDPFSLVGKEPDSDDFDLEFNETNAELQKYL